MATATRRAASLRPGQFRHLIRVASVTGRMTERDVMLLYETLFDRQSGDYSAGV
ncbi:TPA: hypothetical protein ACNIE0_005264 [Pseudomonas aeruginosa]